MYGHYIRTHVFHFCNRYGHYKYDMNELEHKYEANKLLLSLLGSKELVSEWWIRHNRHFDQTPNEAWKLDHERVMIYLYSMDNYF